jgi:hypothetical protein
VSILGLVLLLAGPAAAIVVILGFGLFRPISRHYVNRFLRRYPVRLTAENGPIVLRHLARVRSARTLGGLAGAMVAVLMATFGRPSINVVPIAVGYLAGAIVAEVPWRRAGATARGPAASLVPRQLREYVPRWLVAAPAVVLGVTAVLVIAAALGPRRPNFGNLSVARVLIAIGVMTVATVVTLLTARAILYRAQPYTAPDLLRADDALRASALHCVCGGGFAIVAIAASAPLWEVGLHSDVTLVRWIAPTLAFALILTAYFAWFGLRVAPWLVRRRYDSATAATVRT